jgi:hypothetical protein
MNKAFYYILLLVFLAASAWVGFVVTGMIRAGGYSHQTLVWLSIVGGAVIVGVGVVYFSMKARHGERQIPCNIKDTENVKMNNYHLIMATSKRQRGMVLVKSSDLVNGIAVEPFNRDAHPHRIRIEAGVNGEFYPSTAREMVIDAGAVIPIALPLPVRLSLADIESVDIRIKQV